VGITMEMLRRVLEHPMAQIVVADAVDGKGLEAAPAQREDQRVAVLEDARMPAVFLEARLHVAYLVLALEQRAQHQRGGGAVVLHQLTRYTLNEREMLLYINCITEIGGVTENGQSAF
jgi:hypothetical protein